MYQWSAAGFPCIGGKREFKFALEKFWRGEIGENELSEVGATVRQGWRDTVKDKGISELPVGDFSYYDRMLDMTILFDLLPERFKSVPGNEVNRYFAAARGWGSGESAVEPLAMKKWFNTNYHYLVPELTAEQTPKLHPERLLDLLDESDQSGINVKAVIIGPLTYVALSRCNDVSQEDFVGSLIPYYKELFRKLIQYGVSSVQIDEPILVSEASPYSSDFIRSCYDRLENREISIFLNTFFDSLNDYSIIVNLPVNSIGIDFSSPDSLDDLMKYGFPADKKLVAGIIDGRNIWAFSPKKIESLLQTIVSVVDKEKIILAPSCSLLHLPYTTEEENFDARFNDGIAFAKEKCEELRIIAEDDRVAIDRSQAKFDAFTQYTGRVREKVRIEVAEQDKLQRGRGLEFSERITLQQERLDLPLFPTTTIGSFPQSSEVRRKRRAWRRGELDDNSYEQFIRNEISSCIRKQEEIGVDVLVHGEFERTDMVEFFGEKLAGFKFSSNGWVQSYGSRCVKPPLLFGDVLRNEPISVEETVFADNCTDKPVKGMLTGPVTILNWSFVRDDLSWYEVAKQVALAIGDEVLDLENNGISIIQVDEAALREGVPLKHKTAQTYLKQSVDLFKRTVERVQPDTQIHTHMCYSEFTDIGDTIIGFDADVITVECTRDGGGLFDTFGGGVYPNQIGPGVYDIHSPVIPTKEQFLLRIAALIKHFPEKQLWINPDCGLKTRRWEEALPALKNMVDAVKAIRQ